jgi:hypothetical protein
MKIVVTKHFAERMIERRVPTEFVPRIKAEIKRRACIHIFECCLRPNLRKIIVVDGVAVGVVFCPDTLRFFLTTIYQGTKNEQRTRVQAR